MTFGKNRIGWIDFPIGMLCQQSISMAMMAITIGVSLCNSSSKAIAADGIAFQVLSGNIHCRADSVYLDCEIATNIYEA